METATTYQCSRFHDSHHYSQASLWYIVREYSWCDTSANHTSACLSVCLSACLSIYLDFSFCLSPYGSVVLYHQNTKVFRSLASRWIPHSLCCVVGNSILLFVNIVGSMVYIMGHRSIHRSPSEQLTQPNMLDNYWGSHTLCGLRFTSNFRAVFCYSHTDGLVEDCTISIAKALEILLPSTQPSTCYQSCVVPHENGTLL